MLGKKLIIPVVLIALACSLWADPPVKLQYQGKITQNDIALNGLYDMTFRLYSGSCEGTLLWTEIHNGASQVQITNGLFNVLLGDITAFPEVSTTFNQPLWLQITVGATVMSPCEAFNPVPYAMYAISSPGSGSVNYWSPNGTHIYSNNTGNVGIGTTDPSHKLTVQGGTAQTTYLNVGGTSNGSLSVRHLRGKSGTDATAGDLYIQYYEANNVFLCAGSSQGRVGIGTASPQTKLDVRGHVGIDGASGITIGGWNSNTPDATPRAQLVLDGAHNAGYNLGTKLLISGIDNETDQKAISIVDENSNELFYIKSQPINDGQTYFKGNVGIGTLAPSTKLDVDGTVRIRGGSPAAGRVLTASDANGNATWTTGSSNFIQNLGGIGTTPQQARWRLSWPFTVSTSTDTLTYLLCRPASWNSDAVIYGNLVDIGTISDGHGQAFKGEVDGSYSSLTGTSSFTGAMFSCWDAAGAGAGATGAINISTLKTNYAASNATAFGLAGTATGTSLTPFATTGSNRLAIAGVQAELNGTINNPATMPDTFRVAALWAVDNKTGGTATSYAGFFDGNVYIDGDLTVTGTGGGGGTIGGSGTTNYITKWNPASTTISNARMIDNGTTLKMGAVSDLTTTTAGVTIAHNADGAVQGATDAHIALNIHYDSDATGSGAAIGFGVSSLDEAIGAKIAHVREGSYSYGPLIFYTKPSTGGNQDYTLERMRITANGNIGIGTTSPTGHMLDVASTCGSAGNSAIRALYPGGGGLTNTEFGALAHRDGVWSAVYGRQGSASYAGYFSGNVLLTGSLTANGSTGSAGQVLTSNGAGAAYWNTITSGGSNWTLSGSNLYPLSTGTNIGIGTTGPTTTLDVVGRTTIHPSGTTADNAYNGNLVITKPAASAQYINLIRSGNYPWSIGTVYNSSNFAIGPGNATESSFSPYFVLTTAGNVGIGTTGPLSKLSVNGAGDALYAGYVYGTSTTSGAVAFRGENVPPTSGGNHAYGVQGVVTSGTGWSYGVLGSSSGGGGAAGRAYGVRGQAGGATSGYNYAVIGELLNGSGTGNGAAIIGVDLKGGYSLTQPLPGTYAGWFDGRVRSTGTLQVGNYILPTADGASGQVLKTNGSGTLSWQADNTGAGGDNLGNHTATQNLNMNYWDIRNIDDLDGAESGEVGYIYLNWNCAGGGQVGVYNSDLYVQSGYGITLGGEYRTSWPAGGSSEWTDAGSYVYPNENSYTRVYEDNVSYGFYYSGGNPSYGVYSASGYRGVYGYCSDASSGYEGVRGYGVGDNYGVYAYSTGYPGAYIKTNHSGYYGAEIQSYSGYSYPGLYVNGYSYLNGNVYLMYGVYDGSSWGSGTQVLKSGSGNVYWAADETGGGGGSWTISGNYVYPNSNSNVQMDYNGSHSYAAYFYTTSSSMSQVVYANRPSTNYGGSRGTIYGRRSGTSGETNGGSSYSGLDAGIYGYNYYGNNYSAAVYGWGYNDYNRSAGILGYGSSGSWGAFGYRNSGGTNYGGYWTTSGSGSGRPAPPRGGYDSPYDPGGVHTAIGAGGYGDLFGMHSDGNIYGFYSTGGRYASYDHGDRYLSGLDVHLQDVGRDTMAVLYTNVSLDATVIGSGVGRLVGGSARIRFDEAFAELISETEPIIITVTPIGDCNGINLMTSTNEGFTVAEANSGTNSAQFNWIAIAKRKGHERPQLPREVVAVDYNDKIYRGLHNDGDTRTDGEGLYFEGGELVVGVHESLLPDPNFIALKEEFSENPGKRSYSEWASMFGSYGKDIGMSETDYNHHIASNQPNEAYFDEYGVQIPPEWVEEFKVEGIPMFTYEQTQEIRKQKLIDKARELREHPPYNGPADSPLPNLSIPAESPYQERHDGQNPPDEPAE